MIRERMRKWREARKEKGRKKIGRAWEKEKKKEGEIPTRKVRKNYNYNGKVYSS